MTPSPSDTQFTQTNTREYIEFMRDVDTIQWYIAERGGHLSALRTGIDRAWAERDILDAFIEHVWLESRDAVTRYIAYEKLCHLSENSLMNYIRKSGIPIEKEDILRDRAYVFVAQYHNTLNNSIIEKIESEWLFTPFYRKVLRWAQTVGARFDEFHRSWNALLIQGINRELETRFIETEAIMHYLQEANLLDTGVDGQAGDRAYSILKKAGDTYMSTAYIDALPTETESIIWELRVLLWELECESDDIFWQKENYISYFQALITAFSEADPKNLIAKWSDVDGAWMHIIGPIQIVHPFEYYEDKYRKAVAAEWDVRLQDEKVLKSSASVLTHKMFIQMASELDITEASEIWQFSYQALGRCQIYIGNPLLYSGSLLNWLPSAQVIPNDPEVSKKYGKKIFAFPEHILMRMRARPEMQHKSMMISKNLRDKKKAIIHGDPEIFYKLYDIETIGHELGHTLWLEWDTEVKMNTTGNFKNIEEWKATTGWLVSFFLYWDREMDETVIVEHMVRSISLIEWMREGDVWAYYCEWLIHLKILYDAGILIIDTDWKAEMLYTDETVERTKILYKEHYTKLIRLYRWKQNATLFLEQYTIMEDGYLLPLDETLRTWTKRYYATYAEYGNSIAPSADTI